MTSNNNSREKDISSQLKYRRLTGFLLQLIPPTSITKLDPDQSLHSVMGHQAPLTKLPLRHQRVHNSRRRLHRSWPITKRKRPIRVLQSPSSSSDEDTFRQQMRSRVSVFFIDSVKWAPCSNQSKSALHRTVEKTLKPFKSITQHSFNRRRVIRELCFSVLLSFQFVLKTLSVVFEQWHEPRQVLKKAFLWWGVAIRWTGFRCSEDSSMEKSSESAYPSSSRNGRFLKIRWKATNDVERVPSWH